MDWQAIIITLGSVICGGALVSVIQAIAGRKKSTAETEYTRVKKALEIDALTDKRLERAEALLEISEQNLTDARKEISAYRQELIAERQYSKILEELLIKNNVAVPAKPEL